MKRSLQVIASAVLLVLAALAAGCPAPTDPSMPSAGKAADSLDATPDASAPTGGLVVATWNVEWLFDEYAGDNYSDLAKTQSAPSREDWQWKRDAVAGVIAALRPNVMALQEVEGPRTLWYLQQAIEREHDVDYRSVIVEGRDVFTEQDVALLVRGIDVLRYGRREQSSQMFQSDRFYNVSKHLQAELLWTPTGEVVHVFNVHLRARDERGDIRRRQARLIHTWLAPLIASGANVLVLGDTNSETRAGAVGAASDVGVLAGYETGSEADDLIDLNQYLDPPQRQTHLQEGKQYDRILVSRSLVEDDPEVRDLVFQGIRTRRDLIVQAAPDTPEQHWERYWQMPPGERDVSDHYPVVAIFVAR